MVKERAESQPKIDYYMHLQYSVLLHEIEDEGKKYWIAEVPELPGCTSHGSTVEEAVASLEEAKRDWILDSLENGDEVPTPIDRDRYSGKTLVRMSRSLHRSLSLMAEAEKLSLNQLIVTILAKEIGGFNVLNRLDKKIDTLLSQVSNALDEQEAPLSRQVERLSQRYKTAFTLVGTSPSVIQVTTDPWMSDPWQVTANYSERRAIDIYPYISRPLPAQAIVGAFAAGESEPADLLQAGHK